MNKNYSRILITMLLVIGMTVSFAGAASATTYADLEEGNNYWTGQELNYTNSTIDLNSADIELLNITGDDDDRTFVTEVGSNDQNNLTIDTENLRTDEYVLVVEGSSETDEVNFDLRNQNLDITPEESQLINGNGEDSETEFNIDSNRVDFYMNVTSNGLDGNELRTVFGNGTVNTDDNDVLNVSSDDLETVDFSSVSSDEYNLEFEVVDADANSTATVTVSEPGDAQANFNQSVYSAATGDSTEITIDLEQTDTANVTIGDFDDVGYELVFDIEDSNDDDEVTFEFDSYQAGRSDDVVNSDDDDITVNSQTDFDSDQRLVSLRYDLSVEVNEGGEMRQTDIAFFDLSEQSLDSVNVYGVPSTDVVSEYEDLNNLTQSNTIAEGDTVAIEFNANGVFGPFDEAEVSSADDLSQSSNLSDNHGVYVEVAETSSTGNSQGSDVSLADAELYTNETEERFYLVYDIDTENTDFELDENYEAELRITEVNNDYIDEDDDDKPDEDRAINSTFETSEEETSFTGLNSDGEVEVPNSDEVEIVAETNLAEGSEATFVVTIGEESNTTVDDYDTTVEDGEMRATVDISGLDNGDNFTINARSADVDETTAVVVDDTSSELTVNVVDNNGEEVSDAEITVDGETIVGNTGTFDLTNGEYDVEVGGEGYQNTTETVSVDQPTENVELQLLEEGETLYDLTVDVVDGNGTDVGNAEVTIDDETRTGSSVSFEVLGGDYNASVTADGYEDQTTEVNVSTDTTETITLTSESDDQNNGNDQNGDDGISNLVIIGGGVGGVLILVVLVVYFRRR